MGVDRFFFVENDSTDDTVDVLSRYDNVHVFSTKGSYKKSFFGCIWRLKLFRKYGHDYWCMVVDADEMFIYPDYENTSLKEFCKKLESENFLGYRAIWMQMYSDRPVRQTVWEDKTDPLELCPYFDIDSHKPGPHPKVMQWEYTLDKAPLFYRCKGGPDVWIGQHTFEGSRKESQISKGRGAVLHFKYTADLHERAEEEKLRRQHWASEQKYGGFFHSLQRNPDLALTYEDSVKFEGSEQLVDLGIMKR